MSTDYPIKRPEYRNSAFLSETSRVYWSARGIRHRNALTGRSICRRSLLPHDYCGGCYRGEHARHSDR